jgi:hypothetical protein
VPKDEKNMLLYLEWFEINMLYNKHPLWAVNRKMPEKCACPAKSV